MIKIIKIIKISRKTTIKCDETRKSVARTILQMIKESLNRPK